MKVQLKIPKFGP